MMPWKMVCNMNVIPTATPAYGLHVSCHLTGRDEEGAKIAEDYAATNRLSVEFSGN